MNRRQLSFALLLAGCLVAVFGGIEKSFAQTPAPAAQAPARPAPAAPAPAAQAPTAPAPGAASTTQPPEEPIGNVATLVGTATLTRNNADTPLKLKDDIYLNDVVQTSAKSSLGITFTDATTFRLNANSQMTIDSFVYEEGGKQNNALFDIAKGTVAFAAAAVAKTGDMKISSPTATLGIRGTTGLVEVPEGAAANAPNNVAIKLYPDADGRVGRIEVNDRAGARLGSLTQGASGFTIRPGVAGGRVAAVPLVIPPQQVLRDQGFVRQVHSTQTVGRQVVAQQREFRRANPNFVNPNRPIRNLAPGQRPNGIQNQPGQPGAPNRQGQRPGSPAQPGAAPRTGQPQPGQPTQPATTPRTGAPAQPGTAPRTDQPRPNAPAQPGLPPPNQPGAPQPQPNRLGTPSAPGLQGAPGLQRPGLQRPLPRRPAGVAPPPRGKRPPKLPR